MATPNGETQSFMGWRDMTITPAVWMVTLICPIVFATWLTRRYGWDSFIWFVIFFSSTVVLTLATIAIIRMLWPLKPGTYNVATEPWKVYVWNLIGFLSITNLSFQYMNSLIPPPFRKMFYACMGAQMGGGIISIGGRITDAYLVSIEKDAILGDDSLILAHALTSGGGLILAPVKVGSGAVVGARSILMPGVTVGANSTVKAMSLVTMNTQIPPGEVWGGIPARRMAGGASVPGEAPTVRG